jgi:serine/threonine protein kinase
MAAFVQRRINDHCAAGTFMPEACVINIFARISLGRTFSIKPLNVFLPKDGTVQLADFGIACILEEEALARTQIGTIASLAPEVRQGERCRKADLWALSCLLYELCMKRTPRQNALARRSAPIGRRDSPQIAALVGTMLNLVAKNRPSVATIRQQLLVRAMLAELRISVPDARGAHWPPAPPRKKRENVLPPPPPVPIVRPVTPRPEIVVQSPALTVSPNAQRENSSLQSGEPPQRHRSSGCCRSEECSRS